MKLIYLQNHEIEYRRWDDCINNASHSNIYGYSWYLDIICEGWDAIIADDYSAVMPLPHKRKYFIDYVYPPFFAQQPGIYAVQGTNEATCHSFLNAIPDKFRFIEMNLTVANQWAPSGFETKQLPDLMLNIDHPYDEIRNRYSDNHKRNLIKSEKAGLSLLKQGITREVINMFRSNRGKDISNLKPHHYTLFIRLAEAAMHRGLGKVWTVSNRNGINCAGAVFFESAQKGYFIFSAVSNEGREVQAMHFLIDHYIREMSQKFKVLDFEGSADPNLARFYRGFGASEFLYLQVRKNRLPAPWKWFKK
jgi:hypothetical protein